MVGPFLLTAFVCLSSYATLSESSEHTTGPAFRLDQVADTPPMGWNSWNYFACDGLNETVVLGAAMALVEHGLQDVGYRYVNLDNCWQEPERAADGSVVPSKERFPSWTNMIQKIHDMGLLFGLYTDHGTRTCGSRAPGSYHHEKQDASSYASWKVDFVKDDDCVVPAGATAQEDYGVMSKALQATGRPMVFSVKASEPIDIAPKVCNIRRVGFDIKAFFYDVVREVETNHEQGLAKYARPGFWNDMDMMEVGNGFMSVTEEKTHMSFWCLLKSPLILGNDLSAMSNDTLEILSNREAILVNKDPLGVQGTLRMAYSSNDKEAMVIMANCSTDSHQKWTMNSHDQLVNAATGSCLDVFLDQSAAKMLSVVRECKTDSATQKWAFLENGHVESLALGGCLSIVKPRMPKYQLQLGNCSKGGSGERGFHLNSATGHINSTAESYIEAPQCLSVDNIADLQVWAAPLGTDGEQKAWAALLFNRGLFFSHKITLHWQDFGVPNTTSLSIHDLWLHKDLGAFQGSYTAEVSSHEGIFLRLSPA